jgi:hypothetical protein
MTEAISEIRYTGQFLTEFVVSALHSMELATKILQPSNICVSLSNSPNSLSEVRLEKNNMSLRCSHLSPAVMPSGLQTETFNTFPPVRCMLHALPICSSII